MSSRPWMTLTPGTWRSVPIITQGNHLHYCLLNMGYISTTPASRFYKFYRHDWCPITRVCKRKKRPLHVCSSRLKNLNSYCYSSTAPVSIGTAPLSVRSYSLETATSEIWYQLTLLVEDAPSSENSKFPGLTTNGLVYCLKFTISLIAFIFYFRKYNGFCKLLLYAWFLQIMKDENFLRIFMSNFTI